MTLRMNPHDIHLMYGWEIRRIDAFPFLDTIANMAKTDVNAIDYTKTSYFAEIHKLMSIMKKHHGNDYMLWGYVKDDNDIITRCRALHTLVKEIQKDGVKVPICIWFDDQGRAVISDGWHRTSIAIVLGIPLIDCEIGSRSLPWKDTLPKEKLQGYSIMWEKVITALANLHGKERPRTTYQPIPHPFFHDWTVMRRCDDRYAVFKKELDALNVRSLLDIGTACGWFAHHFSTDGYDVLGIDHLIDSVIVCEFTRFLYPKSTARFLQKNVFDLVKEGQRFDAALCTSVYHTANVEFINALHDMCRVVIFEAPVNYEGNRKQADMIPIFAASKFKNYKLIFTDSEPKYDINGRKTYLLWRE